jgi:serine protease AprX
VLSVKYRLWGGRSAVPFLYLRFVVALSICSAGLLLAFLSFDATASNNRSAKAMSKIAPWVVDHTLNGQQAEFIVVLADQADLSEARKAKTKHEKAHRVRDALWNKAQQTQQPILRWLRQRNIEYRAFYIVNALWVKADANTANALAARPDVLRVEGNPEVHNALDSVDAPTSADAGSSTAAVEPNIGYVHAPAVWSLGYTGQGIVIATADTGQLWTHTALKNQYRGWNGVFGNHDYNWHDSVHNANTMNACGSDASAPCDDTDHGTHTIGTAVGGDGGTNQIGMAPGAKWIGCRNMDQGAGTPARYMECMEFFLAPYPVGGTPAQGDPALAPDISTNSWGCPPAEGCSAATLQAAVEAQRAAGIFMVVSAGNKGPNCSTVQDPPATYDAVYSVGALTSGTDSIVSFSSRGPVTLDASLRLKPNLCAPGTTVRSALNASTVSYGTKSGTSMSTPHVAGAVALLWSAQPLLRDDIEATEALLNESAFPLISGTCDGGNMLSPNNTFGYGRLDAKAAVDYALLEITNIINNTGVGTVTFYAGASRTYRLERKLDLASAGDWEPVPGVADKMTMADGLAQFVDPNAGSSAPVFYRVRIVQ